MDHIINLLYLMVFVSGANSTNGLNNDSHLFITMGEIPTWAHPLAQWVHSLSWVLCSCCFLLCFSSMQVYLFIFCRSSMLFCNFGSNIYFPALWCTYLTCSATKYCYFKYCLITLILLWSLTSGLEAVSLHTQGA